MAAVTTPRPTPESRIKAALWFAERGFGVFTVWSATPSGVCRCPDGAACQSPGKHPVTQHGFQDATRDADRIRTLLLAGSMPNYGLVNPEGVFAWDLDGRTWREKLAAIEARLGVLPPTLTTQTANGEHRFFRWPEGYPRPIGQLFGWVTRWGSGRDAGYVIGPRSIHPSGREYAPGAVFEIATLPEPWAEAILEELRPTTTFTVTGGGYQLPDWGYGGSRYDAIRNYTASRYMRGLERDEIWQGVVGVLGPRFAEPLSEADLRSRFDRAWDKMPERLGPPKEPPDTTDASGEVTRRDDDGELGFLPPPEAGEFPAEPDAVAFEGLIGDCVEDLATGTDAARVGLLGSVLAFAGAYVPGQAHWKRTNTSSPFVALIGESGVGGKGTAMIRVRDAFTHAFPEIATKDVLIGGLNSGEALVLTLDGRRKYSADAIGLMFEEEYGRLLSARQREGSSIDFMMRVAFDGGSLENRKVAGSTVVAPPYWLSALVGITPTELGERLEPGALESGSANRWLYLAVRRRPGQDDTLPRLAPERITRLRDARSHILRQPNPLVLDRAVRARLAEYGQFLVDQSIGIAADLTRRLDVLAMRIALTHALMDRDTTIRITHLDRALALTEYGRRSLPWVFRQTLGDPVAELIYRHLLKDGSLSNRQITREICRDAHKRTKAVDRLRRYRLVEEKNLTSDHGRRRSVLVAVPERASWVPFRASGVTDVTSSEMHAEETTPDSRTASGTTRRHHGDNGVTTAGQHSDNVRQEGSVWIVACRDFMPHRNDHHQRGDGWYCAICNPELIP